MVIGYSLGNRSDVETDIQVVGEDDPNTLAYSPSLPVSLTRMCRNSCPYCSFKRRDNLTVPYSTIKTAKLARSRGIREGLYISGEMPEQYPHIRALLDIWGFSTYIDYVYTVCELGFLEGLIPVIEVGFLNPLDLKRLSEICALTKIMLDSVDAKVASTLYAQSPGKKLDLRLKQLDWAGKLKFPTVTGIIVGIGESKEHRKDAIKAIADIHKQYGTIHEVLLQNFVPEPGTAFEKKSAPTKETMLQTVEMALSILPSDVSVTVPIECNPDMEPFIKAGIRDLGRFPGGFYKSNKSVDLEKIEEMAAKLGFKLQQRFPLKKGFIKEGLYSKKLGQVFDSYRYKIKKEG